MNVELGVVLIIVAGIIAFMYGKMILIWRDVMLKNNEKIKRDLEMLDKRAKKKLES